uniref:Polyprotein n=1 Tax=Apple virus A TaxID=2709745 RepID=A0A6C0X1B3_9VIRU|nr:MAG: polyprotein [Apple virus A]
MFRLDCHKGERVKPLFPPQNPPREVELSDFKEALKSKWLMEVPWGTPMLVTQEPVNHDKPEKKIINFPLGTCTGPMGEVQMEYFKVYIVDPQAPIDIQGHNPHMYPIYLYKQTETRLHHIEGAYKVRFIHSKPRTTMTDVVDIDLSARKTIVTTRLPTKMPAVKDIERAGLLKWILSKDDPNTQPIDAYAELTSEQVGEAAPEPTSDEPKHIEKNSEEDTETYFGELFALEPQFVPLPDDDESKVQNFNFKLVRTRMQNTILLADQLNDSTDFQDDQLLLEHYNVFKNLPKWRHIVDRTQLGVNTLRSFKYSQPITEATFKKREYVVTVIEDDEQFDKASTPDVFHRLYNSKKLGIVSNGSCLENCCPQPCECFQQLVCTTGCHNGVSTPTGRKINRFKLTRELFDSTRLQCGTLCIDTNLTIDQLSSLYNKAQDVQPYQLIMSLHKVERPIYSYSRPVETVQSGYRFKPIIIQFPTPILEDNWHVLVMSDSTVDAMFFTGRRHINRELNFILYSVDDGPWIPLQLNEDYKVRPPKIMFGIVIQPGITPEEAAKKHNPSLIDTATIVVEPQQQVTRIKFSLSDTSSRYDDGFYDFYSSNYPVSQGANIIEAEIEEFNYSINSNLIEAYPGVKLIEDDATTSLNLEDASGPLIRSGIELTLDDEIEPIMVHDIVDARETFKQFIALTLKELTKSEAFAEAFHLCNEMNMPGYICHHKSESTACLSCAKSLFAESEYHSASTKVLQLALKKTLNALQYTLFYKEWPEFIEIYKPPMSRGNIIWDEMIDLIFGQSTYTMTIGNEIKIDDKYISYGELGSRDRKNGNYTVQLAYLRELPIHRLNERVNTMSTYTVSQVDSCDENFAINSWVLQNSTTLKGENFKILIKLFIDAMATVTPSSKIKPGDRVLACCIHQRKLLKIQRIDNLLRHEPFTCCSRTWVFSNGVSDVSRFIQLMAFFSKKRPEPNHPVQIEGTVGGPGTGKTYSTKSKLTGANRPDNTLALGKSRNVSNKLMTELADFATVNTMEGYIKNYPHKTYDTVILEEATLFSVFDRQTILNRTQAKRMILVGDPTQGSWKPDIGAKVYGEFPNALTGVKVDYMTKVYRYGKAITDVLQYFGLELEPAEHETSLTVINTLEQYEELSDAMFLTWTVNDYNELAAQDKKVMMVEASQGYDWDNVVIYLSSAHSVQSVYNKMNWIIALTRAKYNLTICSVGELLSNAPVKPMLQLIAKLCDINATIPAYVAKDHLDLLPHVTTTISNSYLNLMARVARTTQRIASLTTKFGRTAALLATNPATAAISVAMAGWQLYFGFFMAIGTAFNGIKPQIILMQSLQHERPPTALGEEYTTSPPLSWFLDTETKLAEEIRQFFENRMDTLSEIMDNLKAAKEEGINAEETFNTYEEFSERNRNPDIPVELLNNIGVALNVKFKNEKPIEFENAENQREYYVQSAITAASVAGYIVGTRYDHSVQAVFESARQRKISIPHEVKSGYITTSTVLGKGIVSTEAGWVKRNLYIFYALDQISDLSTLNIKTIYNNIMGIQQVRALTRFADQEHPHGIARNHTNRPVGAMLSTNSAGRMRLSFGEHDLGQLQQYSKVRLQPTQTPRMISYVGADTGSRLTPAKFTTPEFYSAPKLDIYRLIEIELVTSKYIGEKYNDKFWAGVLWDFEGLDVRGLKTQAGALRGLEAFAMQTMHIELITVSTSVQEVRDWIFARSRPTDARHARSHRVAGADDHDPNKTPIIIKAISIRKIATGLKEIEDSIEEQVRYAETLINRRELLRQAQMRNTLEKQPQLNMEDFNNVLAPPSDVVMASSKPKESLPKPEPPEMTITATFIGMWEPPFVNRPKLEPGWELIEVAATPARRVWSMGGVSMNGIRWKFAKSVRATT